MQHDEPAPRTQDPRLVDLDRRQESLLLELRRLNERIEEALRGVGVQAA
ncbi:MAG: hypothetical protein ACRCT8_16880 [Lacipirellulaceae bacterium]